MSLTKLKDAYQDALGVLQTTAKSLPPDKREAYMTALRKISDYNRELKTTAQRTPRVVVRDNIDVAKPGVEAEVKRLTHELKEARESKKRLKEEVAWYKEQTQPNRISGLMLQEFSASELRGVAQLALGYSVCKHNHISPDTMTVDELDGIFPMDEMTDLWSCWQSNLQDWHMGKLLPFQSSYYTLHDGERYAKHGLTETPTQGGLLIFADRAAAESWCEFVTQVPDMKDFTVKELSHSELVKVLGQYDRICTLIQHPERAETAVFPTDEWLNMIDG